MLRNNQLQSEQKEISQTMTQDKNDGSWLKINQCPSCSCLSKINRGKIPLDFYCTAGSQLQIKIPESGVFLYECKSCGLLYKSLIPSKQFMRDLINEQSSKIWSSNYKYEDEINLINGLLDNQASSYALLDVGSAHGNLLKVSSKYSGRRSSIDIVKYPDLFLSSDGEFIEGFLDSDDLVWNENPYDIVTVFDVLEHLYDPNISFYNLRKFVKKGGFVIIETGDSDHYWHFQNKINYWQYICYIEHHIIWNYRSLVYQAEKNGFEIISFVNKQHKEIKNFSFSQKTKHILLLTIYIISEKIYSIIIKIMNKKSIQPRNIFAKDHFLAILKKVE